MPLPTGSVVTLPAPLAGGGRDAWMLDPRIEYLNHGSFGARLHAAFAAQVEARRRMEADPIEVLGRRAQPELAAARVRIAGFLGAEPDGVGFVANASEGICAVLRSRAFRPGDRVVTTTHVYNAVRQALREIAVGAGATCIEVPIPVPVEGPDVVLARLRPWLESPTRLLVIDHVTSPTALVFPVAQAVRAAREAGVDVLVDGAHAPGMVPLHIEALGADWYTGNLHKWAGAAPGTAFLWTSAAKRATTHPLVISHNLGAGYGAEFDWQGTRDLTGWLTAAHAIDLMDALDGPGSWPRILEHNRRLAVWAGHLLSDAWSTAPCAPADGSMTGAMASVRVPDAALARTGGAEALQARLRSDDGIEVPVIPWSDGALIRVSCQVYNRPAQYERLAEAVLRIAGSASAGGDP